MKHLKIVLTLVVVVLVASMAVYFVEALTTPIIDAYNLELANKAKYEVLPELTTNDDITPTTEYDFTGTSISELIIVEDKGYIYTATAAGYVGPITYMIAFDLDGNITGYKTLIQTETVGLGSVIADDPFQDQFVGLNPDDIDGIGGTTAVVTLGGLISSLEKLAVFHSVEFEGAVVETPEQRLLRYKEEITEVGATFTDVTSDYDISESPITKVEKVNETAVIYTVIFAGYTASVIGDGTPDIIYLVAFDLTTNDIIGFRVVEQNETYNYGDIIETPDFQAQFDDLAQDAIDDVAGTTCMVTLGGLKASLEDVVVFHKEAFEGTVAETDAEKLLRYKQEISVDGAIITDVSGDFDLTDTNVVSVEYANDGTDDVAVIYTVLFVGYNTSDVVEYLISFDLVTNDILGLRVTYQSETLGYGSNIQKDEYYVQFAGMDQLDAFNGNIDGIGGATITFNAFKVSLNEIVRFHQAEFQGIITETDLERFERLLTEIFPTWTTYKDVTRDYPADHDIIYIYDIYEDETYIGVIYYVDTPGAGISMSETYIQFLVGVNLDNQFAGFRMIDDNDTESYSAPFYLEAYEDSYLLDSIEVPLDVDSVAGSTITNDKIEDAVTVVANYHLDNYTQRPDNVDALSEDLLFAFPTAVSFVSVYEDYEYNSNIYNIYEALDGSDNVIGYVYFGHAEGYVDDNVFVWGVDLAGVTQKLIIVSSSESWAYAEEWDDYDGSSGYWPDSPWILNFEGVTFSDLLSNPDIDDVAGVSTTTASMREVLEIIAQYHSDESVGGAG